MENKLSEKNLLPKLTTDAIVFSKDNKQILLITRGHEPFTGKLALPGGHLNYGEEPFKCCIRELKEETNLDIETGELLCVKGDPNRDPRGHRISIVYIVKVKDFSVLKAGDDAATAKFYNFEEIIKKNKEEFAFDHFEIIQEAKIKIG